MYIPIVSSCVPPATPGPHKNTGYAFVRAPASQPLALPFPKRQDGSPVLNLDEVHFSVYYPTSEHRAARAPTVQWMPKPVGAVLDGYAAYFGGWGPKILFSCLKPFAARFQIPLTPNAPLLNRGDKYPLVILSHGLSGTRNTYSQFCQALASEGYIVLAIEHRDGSGPMFVTTPEGSSGDTGKVTGYAANHLLQWQGERPEMLRLRGLQLDFRVREVYEVYAAFTAMQAGKSKARVEGMTDQERIGFFQSLGEHVDASDLQMTGHSMGGGTTIRLLQTAPPDGFDALPLKHAVTLDPWLLPFPHADSMPDAKMPPPPLLSINSQGYSEWQPHFHDVVNVSRDLGGSLVTIIGINHEGFSDEHVIASLRYTRAQDLLSTIHKLTMANFTDSVADSPLVRTHEPDEGNWPAKDRAHKKMRGSFGDVIVHLV